MKKQMLLGQLLETVESLKGDRKHKKRDEKRSGIFGGKREEMKAQRMEMKEKMTGKTMEEMKAKRMEMKEKMTGKTMEEMKAQRMEMKENMTDETREEMKKKCMEMRSGMLGEDKMKKRNHKMSSATKNILCHLLSNEDINQQTLAKTMNISPQATSEIIKRLESRGLILKTSGEYKNENIINLTEEGREVADNVDKKIKEEAKNIFKDFNEEELDLFSRLIKKLNIPKKNKEDNKER